MTSNTATQDRRLLQPFMFGDLELPNRIVMAPLTRMRTPKPNGVPNDLMNHRMRG